jgi:glucosamine--fructose-6-phosphate aminotransferase (isomerizing)
LSDQDGARVSVSSHSGAGVHALAEILSQPQCWSDCFTRLQQKEYVELILEPFRGSEEWLFVGCGTSYYLAMAAASSWSSLTGQRARAVPASELLLFPEPVLAGSKNLAAAVISRSGRTSEALRAAEILERKKEIPTLAVTCTADQPLAQITTRTLLLEAAREESTVMTRSFTSMLLGLQYLAASTAQNRRFLQLLQQLPAAAAPILDELHPQLRDFVSSRQFADYVCLGQGPFFGLACESALKLTEMSVSYAQSFHTLEFRHGPKSIVSPETLVMFLLSESGFDAECEVLREIKGLGGATLAITNRANDVVRASSDLLIEFGTQLPEFVFLAPFVFGAQLAGLYTGLKRGLDPDHPRNLSPVVLLDEEDSSETEHATL